MFHSDRYRLRDPLLSLAIVSVLALLVLFILMPLLSILWGSFVSRDTGVLSLDTYLKVFADKNFRTTFGNTLWLGTVVGWGSRGPSSRARVQEPHLRAAAVTTRAWVPASALL